MEVDLLLAECEGHTLCARRSEALESHAKRIAIEPDAALQIARREDNVVDVIDHDDVLERRKKKGSEPFSPLDAVAENGL